MLYIDENRREGDLEARGLVEDGVRDVIGDELLPRYLLVVEGEVEGLRHGVGLL